MTIRQAFASWFEPPQRPRTVQVTFVHLAPKLVGKGMEPVKETSVHIRHDIDYELAVPEGARLVRIEWLDAP